MMVKKVFLPNQKWDFLWDKNSLFENMKRSFSGQKDLLLVPYMYEFIRRGEVRGEGSLR